MARPVYELTPEHRAQLGPWHERWLKIALNTDPMVEDDREACRVAVEGMYRAAKLTPPPRERIVFVPSPYAAVLAGGFASAIWYLRDNPAFAASLGAAKATRAATRDATFDATFAATSAATFAATSAATRDATRDATIDATRAATIDATIDATFDATFAATSAATRDATSDATSAATSAASSRLTPLAAWFLECANSVAHNLWYYYDGGAEWTGWVEYLSFFKDIVRLDLPVYEDYVHYEAVTLHGGVRIMHKEFCIISDRPREIHIETVNDRGRLHNPNGPAKSYRDGWSIYAVHGVRVPAQVIEAPETLTAQQIASETNAEVRRVMMDRFTAARFIREIGAKKVDEHELHGKLYRYDQKDDEAVCVLEVVNASPEPIGYEAGPNDVLRDGRVWKTYFLRVPPTCRTALDARAWTFDVKPKDFAPLVET